jgi:murein DD-endopeptidase MepM/ murein hydrolase activator NlpD
MASTPSGGGYWLVAADGGVFSFGDAVFRGSTGGLRLNQAIVGMASTPSGGGYWLVAADGGVFSFGDAPFLGSDARPRLDAVVAILSSGGGYLVAARDGEIAAFGTPGVGSLALSCKDQAFVAATTRPGGGAWLASSPVPWALPSADALATLADESDQLATVVRLGQGCQATPSVTSGLLGSPLPGARTTTVFGWRIHPIFGRLQFHSGIDLAGPTRILAADDGTVSEIRDRGGYGFTTVIDHGNGIATVYAHQAAVSVAIGQRVNRGQGIGTVGSSGYATGPHLHFEVRVHGVPTDPRGWF